MTYYPVLASTNVKNQEVNETSIVLSGLEIYTNYSVSVAAFTAVGTGPPASVIRATDSLGELALILGFTSFNVKNIVLF